VTHDPRAVLEAFAASLDAGEVLSRFPGLAREQLRVIVLEAAGRLPRAEARPKKGTDLFSSVETHTNPSGQAGKTHLSPISPAEGGGAWPSEVTVHIDGGARGNPGEAGVGAYFQDRSGAPLQSIARYIGRATNNTAEYQALLMALARARDAGVKHLRVFSDSELLVNQVNGRYRTTVPHLQQYLQEAIRLMREIGRVDVSHVRREFNKEADALANEAMDNPHG
jgi:ribonuclease HI